MMKIFNLIEIALRLIVQGFIVASVVLIPIALAAKLAWLVFKW